MAQLSKFHDVTPMCAKEANRYAINHVKFDAKTHTLVATDGKIGIVVPVVGECDAPDSLLPPDALKDAAENRKDLGVLKGKLTIDKKAVELTDGMEAANFPNLFSCLNTSEPDLVIPLTLETLEPLVRYTKRHGDGGIYLMVHHKPGSKWQDRAVTTAIQFCFDAKQADKGAEPVQVVGALMPALLENDDAVHSRIRAALTLVSAGKSAKEKAAEARKKAVSRKAAQAAALEQHAKHAKAGKAKAAAAEEDDEPEVEAPAKNGKAKGKGKGQAAKPAAQPAKNGKATKPAKAEQDERPVTNGHGNTLPVADLITRAQASLSRQKFAAARRFLNTARTEIEAGNGDDELLKRIDALDVKISKDKAAHKKGK